MRVVHLLHFFEPGYVGGIQRYVGELVRSQRDSGIDASVFTVGLPRGSRARIDPDEAARWERDYGRIPVTRRTAWALWQRTPVYPTLFRDLRRLEADVIHLHGPSPWFEAAVALGGSLRGRLVVTLHNTFPRTTAVQRWLGGVGRMLLHRAMDRADAVIAPHAAFLEDLVPERLGRRWAGRMQFVPPGIDHDRFHPTGAPRDPGAVLFVAHLRPEKGLHVLVEAMARLPGYRLEVLASVSYERGYYQRVRRRAEALLGSRVRFTLAPDAETLRDAYNRAGCVVVPSLGLESWNLVLLEAAACGAPCVRTDLPGLAWADFAVAAAAGDPASLADAIEAAMADRKGLGERARLAAA